MSGGVIGISPPTGDSCDRLTRYDDALIAVKSNFAVSSAAYGFLSRSSRGRIPEAKIPNKITLLSNNTDIARSAVRSSPTRSVRDSGERRTRLSEPGACLRWEEPGL